MISSPGHRGFFVGENPHNLAVWFPKFGLTMKKVSLLSLLISSFGFAQTDVSGTISSNTTWVVSGSPYTITANTVIMDDVNLTINAGVSVLFDSDAYLGVLTGETIVANGTYSFSYYAN